MSLSSDDIQRIAQLARLELQPQESELLQHQLNHFFGVVEQINAVDTAAVEPLHTPLAAMQSVALRLREDQVSESVDRAANQRSAPAVHEGLFLVPKVIE
jgi:aspartyl-tRNA(Asn)/glutamyl-tRNA(Gln) amidotransferase subunit C